MSRGRPAPAQGERILGQLGAYLGDGLVQELLHGGSAALPGGRVQLWGPLGGQVQQALAHDDGRTAEDPDYLVPPQDRSRRDVGAQLRERALDGGPPGPRVLESLLAAVAA